MKKFKPAKKRDFALSSSMYPTLKTWIRKPTKQTTNSMFRASPSKRKPKSKLSEPSSKRHAELLKSESAPDANSAERTAPSATAADSTETAAPPHLLLRKNSAITAADKSGRNKTKLN